MIPFVKYHGTGNDFILIDDRKTMHNLEYSFIRKLCDRHFGIGADGLIQIREKSGFDFEMIYYNSDGLLGSMCGNGGRCAVAFTHSLGLNKDHIEFSAFDGEHEAKIISKNPFVVSLHMNNVNNIERNDDFIFLNTGSPHYVTFVKDVDKINIVEEGRKVRYNDRFRSDGVNVNFVQQQNGALHIRTYERGVEDETLSCGTGITASVLASAFSGKEIHSGCDVITPGGNLKVYFKKTGDSFSDIWLEGEASHVFSGEIDLNN